MAKIVKDLNQGNVVKTMLTFALPLLWASLIQMLYTTADMVIVGKFVGKSGLGSVSVGGDIAHFLLFFAIGFSNAGQVIISQYLGAGLKEKVGKIIGTLFSFQFSSAVILGIITILFRKSFLQWVNTPEEIFEETSRYVLICLSGLIFIFGYNAVSAILRGMGDSKHPLIFVAVSTAVNVVLDLLFVVVFKWGVAGAALATVISQGICFISSLLFLWKNRSDFGFDFKLRSFMMSAEALKPLMSLGIPMLLQSSALCFSMLFVNSYINSYGLAAAAMNGIGNKVSMLVNAITFALASAGSPMIGQAIGAEKYERVPKILAVALTINSALSLAMGIVVVLFPLQVFGIFTSDSELLQLSLTYVPVTLVLLLGSALRPPMTALINGSGNFKLNLLVGLLDGVFMRIGLSLLFGLVCGFGVYGFWYGHATAGLTPFFIGAVYFISGRWKTRKYIIRN